MTDTLLDDALALAHRLADAARPVARRYFRTPVGVDVKPDTSPVTIADREVEAAMRVLIEARFPDHGILGEEHGAARTDAEYVWVLDPIDGTRAFITGLPLFGTLIALTRRGVPVLGIIDQPISQERWVGVRGRATTHNGAPVRTRACPEIGLAYLYSTAPEMFDGAFAAPYERLRSAVRQPRYGADCYAYGLLALGFVDLVVENKLQPYDYCALVPIIEGAGGIATDWQGAPLTIASAGNVLAAGDPAAHRAALKLLRM